MANKKKKSKTEKALGQDPFEGMFEPGWEEADNEIITAEPPIEPSEVTDEPESELETVTEVETTQAAELPAPATEPEVETAPVTETNNGDNQTTEPPDVVEVEENSGVLDEIIATIDQEIEQTLGVDLLSDRDDKILDDMSGIEEQHIIFTLAGTRYAVPAANVREVGDLANLTPIPNVPDWLLGVTNLRGDVLSVVDLHALLNLGQPDQVESLLGGEDSFNAERELLIVHPREDAALMTTGLIVDEVNDIRYLTVDRIVAPAAPIEDQLGPYLRGVYEYEEGLLVILDFDKLLLSSDMRQFEPV